MIYLKLIGEHLKMTARKEWVVLFPGSVQKKKGKGKDKFKTTMEQEWANPGIYSQSTNFYRY